MEDGEWPHEKYRTYKYKVNTLSPNTLKNYAKGFQIFALDAG